jgi:hypothetical protein
MVRRGDFPGKQEELVEIINATRGDRNPAMKPTVQQVNLLRLVSDVSSGGIANPTIYGSVETTAKTVLINMNRFILEKVLCTPTK